MARLIRVFYFQGGSLVVKFTFPPVFVEIHVELECIVCENNSLIQFSSDPVLMSLASGLMFSKEHFRINNKNFH